MTETNDKFQNPFQNYLVIFLPLNLCVLGHTSSMAKISEN